MLPTGYGGGGGDCGQSAVLAKEMAARGLNGIDFGLHSDIIAPSLHRLGTPAQKDDRLPRCAAGGPITAIAMTEPGTGNDLKNIRTTARRESDEYVINGAKTLISNGRLSDLVVVVAKTDPQGPGSGAMDLVLGETDRPGLRRGRQLDKVASTRPTRPSCSSTMCAFPPATCSAKRARARTRSCRRGHRSAFWIARKL